MARMTEEGLPASVGPKTKQRTVRCPHCSIELNLPESALGRRLKCPKCESKFVAPAAGVAGSFDAGSSLYLPIREGSSGSNELPSFGGSSGDVELPTSLAPLRETFDLPLLNETGAPRGPKSASGIPTGAKPAVADALALFQDEPKSTRKPKGAEARAQARRCSSCSSIVAAGMSLCSRCGLDLDTGQRITPIDVFDDDMPVAHRRETPPLAVMLVGGVCAFGFLLLSMISLIAWAGGTQGAQFLLIIWMFGLFGAVQFLRRKSIRPMFVALSLAIGVGSIYLIALPIYYANVVTEEVVSETNPLVEGVARGLDVDAPVITSVSERLALHRIGWGVGSLVSYAVLAVYLNSPKLRRQFKS